MILPKTMLQFCSTLIPFVLIYASKKFRLKNKKARKILFVGDSQTAIRTDGGDTISYTYPNLVKAQLESQGYTIDVLALGGKQTSWMKENLPNQLAQKRYDRVYIYGGGNDVSSAKSVDSVVANIQEMVNMANNNGADAFVTLGYRIDNFADPYKMPKTIYVTHLNNGCRLSKRESNYKKPYQSKYKELILFPFMT